MMDRPLLVRRVDVPYIFDRPVESPLLESPSSRCKAGNRKLMSDLKEGMQAMKMATATSTLDQLRVLTSVPIHVVNGSLAAAHARVQRKGQHTGVVLRKIAYIRRSNYTRHRHPINRGYS